MNKNKEEHWIDAPKEKPESGQKVLAILAGSKRHIITAVYTAPKTENADFVYFIENFLIKNRDYIEKDEKNDCYWIIEGWWEFSTQGEFIWTFIGSHKNNLKIITHWMPLPKLPEIGVNNV